MQEILTHLCNPYYQFCRHTAGSGTAFRCSCTWNYTNIWIWSQHALIHKIIVCIWALGYLWRWDPSPGKPPSKIFAKQEQKGSAGEKKQAAVCWQKSTSFRKTCQIKMYLRHHAHVWLNLSLAGHSLPSYQTCGVEDLPYFVENMHVLIALCCRAVLQTWVTWLAALVIDYKSNTQALLMCAKLLVFDWCNFPSLMTMPFKQQSTCLSASAHLLWMLWIERYRD